MNVSQGQEAMAVATTLGLLVDGRELCKNDAALGRWASSEFRRFALEYQGHGTKESAKHASEKTEKALRELCNGRLPPGALAKLDTILTAARKHYQHRRWSERATARKRSIAERWVIAKKYMAKRIEGVIVPAFEKAEYRLASSSWAGGDNDYCVEIGQPSVARAASKVWSKNGKWSGKSCDTTFTVRLTWMADVGPLGAIVSYKERRVVVLDHRDGETCVVLPGRGFDLYTAWVLDKFVTKEKT